MTEGSEIAISGRVLSGHMSEADSGLISSLTLTSILPSDEFVFPRLDLAELRALSVDDSGYNATQSLLLACQRLERLDIEGAFIDVDRLEQSLRSTQIRRLFLFRCIFSQAAVGMLANLQYLEELFLCSCLSYSGGPLIVSGLGRSRSLRFLDCGGTDTSDIGLLQETCPKLEVFG